MQITGDFNDEYLIMSMISRHVYIFSLCKITATTKKTTRAISFDLNWKRSILRFLDSVANYL